MIIEGLKKRLYDENCKKGGKWIHEWAHVVWGLRTQPSKATGQTPFFLVYGSEAILPADIMWKSPWAEMYNEGEADEARQLELDFAKEARCTCHTRFIKNINRAIIYASGSSHAYIQQNHQDITTHITNNININRK
jgi:hypothetical protein